MKNIVKFLSLVALITISGAKAMTPDRLDEAQKKQVSEHALNLYTLKDSTIEFCNHIIKVREGKAKRADDQFYTDVITKLGNAAGGLYYTICEGSPEQEKFFANMPSLKNLCSQVYAVWHTLNSNEINQLLKKDEKTEYQLYKLFDPAGEPNKGKTLDLYLGELTNQFEKFIEKNLVKKSELNPFAPANYEAEKRAEYQKIIEPIAEPKKETITTPTPPGKTTEDEKGDKAKKKGAGAAGTSSTPTTPTKDQSFFEKNKKMIIGSSIFLVAATALVTVAVLLARKMQKEKNAQQNIDE